MESGAEGGAVEEVFGKFIGERSNTMRLLQLANQPQRHLPRSEYRQLAAFGAGARRRAERRRGGVRGGDSIYIYDFEDL